VIKIKWTKRELYNHCVPIGFIMEHDGDEAPKNWDWCDGKNETPNLIKYGDCGFIQRKE